MSIEPLVSVRTITYNHEPYIARCLDGILAQRTDFPFELVIGEDCSTDGTRAIVERYANAYPDTIRLITSAENVGAAANTRRVAQACRGRYQAFCEGDDYWIDPRKLQKQVDFMEAHPEVTMCFHNLFVVKERDYAAKLYFSQPMKELWSFEDACQSNVQVASVLLRSEVIDSLPAWRTQVWCPDVVLRLWCAHLGPLGYLDEIMAVYRRHPGGMISQMDKRWQERRDQEMFMYQQLDKDTGHVHTAPLQALAARTQERFQRERVGWRYFLTHPRYLLLKIAKYRDLISKQFGMYR